MTREELCDAFHPKAWLVDTDGKPHRMTIVSFKVGAVECQLSRPGKYNRFTVEWFGTVTHQTLPQVTKLKKGDTVTVMYPVSVTGGLVA